MLREITAKAASGGSHRGRNDVLLDVASCVAKAVGGAAKHRLFVPVTEGAPDIVRFDGIKT